MKTDKWKQVIFYVFIICAIAAIAVNVLIDYRGKIEKIEHEKKIDDQSQKISELTLKLDDMEKNFMGIFNENLESRVRTQLVAKTYKNISNSSDEDAIKWAEERIKSIPETQEELDIVSIQEKELRDDLESKWAPFVEIILEDFEQKIEALQDKFKGLSIEKSSEYEIIKINVPNRLPNTIVTASFPNGSFIRIQLTPGIIRYGKYADDLLIRFRDSSINSAILIGFNQHKIGVRGYDLKYYNTEKIPLDDEEFVRKTKDAISMLIDRVLNDDYRKGQ